MYCSFEFNTEYTLFIAVEEILDMKRRLTELEGYMDIYVLYVYSCIP